MQGMLLMNYKRIFDEFCVFNANMTIIKQINWYHEYKWHRKVLNVYIVDLLVL